MNKNYLFRSPRLGFRAWLDEDIPTMAAINADPVVMEFFPTTQTLEQTQGFVKRMNEQQSERGYCYFAVDRLDNGQLIGFIGLSWQTYEAPFTPAPDIGWRIARQQWNQGLATEGALACLKYAFEALELQQIYSVAPVINLKSQRIMQKIGMQKIDTFDHPALVDYQSLQSCALYAIQRPEDPS